MTATTTHRAGSDLRPFLSVYSTYRFNAPEAHLLRNVDLNCSRGLMQVPALPARDETFLICADGPDLDLNEVMRERGEVCAIKGAHDHLAGNGVGVDYFVACDARPTTFITPLHKTIYCMASLCDPSLFARLKHTDGDFDPFDVFVWHATLPEGTAEIVLRHYRDAVLIGGGSTAALRAINIGYRLGFRRFVLFGCGSSFVNGKTHASGKRTEGSITVECAGRLFDTNVQMARQVTDFMEVSRRFMACGYGNDPVTFDVRGDGLLAHAHRNDAEIFVQAKPQPKALRTSDQKET